MRRVYDAFWSPEDRFKTTTEIVLLACAFFSGFLSLGFFRLAGSEPCDGRFPCNEEFLKLESLMQRSAFEIETKLSFAIFSV